MICKSVEKSHLVGRDYSVVKQEQRRTYLDVYNPRLDDVFSVTKAKGANDAIPEHARKYHINRGFGAMIRQAWPWGTVEEAGLAFLAFSLSLRQIDDALRRMAGETDGYVDALLSVTRSVKNAYFYVPTLVEIERISLHK